MILRAALACTLFLAGSGCCFTPPGATAPPPPIAPTIARSAPTVASATTMLSLPTNPPLSFAGVEGPMPNPGMPHGMPGALARAGTATVTTSSGTLPLPIGTMCSYVQWRVETTSGGFDCRWNVTCAGVILYGMRNDGYERCVRPEWPAGTIMLDDGTEAMNGDPLFLWDANGMSLGDDPSGNLGAWSVTLRPLP